MAISALTLLQRRRRWSERGRVSQFVRNTALAAVWLAWLTTANPAVWAQPSPAQTAEEEAVRRQENTILLRRLLKDAREVREKDDLVAAAKLYEEAWTMVQRVGVAAIEKESQETVAGFTAVYLELAKKSYSRAQYIEAKNQVSRVLRIDPKNEDGQALMAKVDKTLKELEGRLQRKDTLSYLQEVARDRVTVGTLVQDGKLFYEMGKLD